MEIENFSGDIIDFFSEELLGRMIGFLNNK